ncbi:MAG TPA: HypC/HybG/HupF family hydrogenase formation chaperone [Candidatus Nanoarchaeia archaeon]|nr:HypC/HybG/HupF family hydrogenase formation chaperone [Candidatus Nanoarchaeia archaeon]
MCLAVPGRIVKIAGDIATVDYDIEKREGKIIEGEYGKGDYVLVQGGIVIEKVEEREAREALEMYKRSAA